MGWRFRQSFTVVPGLRLNLSKSGLSASIGGAPFTLNVGPRGVMGTASIPGTGISYRHHVSTPATPHVRPHTNPSTYIPAPPPPVLTPSYIPSEASAPLQEIHSASTELLTSTSLKELKKLIQTAFQQLDEISRELDGARNTKATTERRFKSWERGFLFKRVFKKSFAARQEQFETETARVTELEEQRRLSTIATHIEVEKEQSELYYRLRDEFAALRDCAAIWDVKSFRGTDKVRERTTASRLVTRERVRFELGSCELIQWDEKIPLLRNAKGGEFYLYPGFILYRAAREAFSLIQYHDVQGKANTLSFQEEETVPSDSEIIGQAWAKANKDGSRDKRFANNYQIPIARYGQLGLKSDNGLWEEFEFSSAQKMVNFVNALNAFTTSFEGVADA